MKLSICIITKNEEKDLPRCLESVKDLADEIIVVDDGSTDHTKEIAKKYGAKIFEKKLDSFAEQKNFAVEKAGGDWIFSIDADEECTKELTEEIKKVISDQGTVNSEMNGYLVPRRNIILRAEIKHTRWSPDIHIWLWKRGKGKWAGRVHEEVRVEGKVGRLKNAKMHYQYKTVTEFFAMLNNYTEREAQEKVENGERFSYFMLFYAPALSIFRRFIYKRGFLDGRRGFVLSYLMAIYRMTTWIKVWEKENI